MLISTKFGRRNSVRRRGNVSEEQKLSHDSWLFWQDECIILLKAKTQKQLEEFCVYLKEFWISLYNKNNKKNDSVKMCFHLWLYLAFWESLWPFLQSPLPHTHTHTKNSLSHAFTHRGKPSSHVLTLAWTQMCWHNPCLQRLWRITSCCMFTSTTHSDGLVFSHRQMLCPDKNHPDWLSTPVGRLGRCWISVMLTCAVIGYTIMYDTVTQFWV